MNEEGKLFDAQENGGFEFARLNSPLSQGWAQPTQVCSNLSV
jgi:hypothetical protein